MGRVHVRHSLGGSRSGSRLISHRIHTLARALLTERTDGYVTDRSLEFDKGMCTVVAVGRDSLAVSAEVCIVANCTLVANSRDVLLVALAEWAVAEDAKVDFTTFGDFSNGLIDRGESMAWVSLWRLIDAFKAIIPIRAVQTLVSNADEGLKSSQL